VAKTLKFGNAVVCEYAAQGNRNKHTLVNVYSGDIITAEMPATLRLGFYIEHFPDAESPMTIVLTITHDSEKIAELSVAVGGRPKIGKTGVILIPGLNIPVPHDGAFAVVASADGYRDISVIQKRIFMNPDLSPTASPPPSEQSPLDVPEPSSPPAPSRRAAPSRRRRS
jgi:hypothetical protein